MESKKNEAMVSKPEMQNKAIVDTLYKALAHGDTSTVVKILTTDLEWWFHGPPRCHHMMRVLTGESSHSEFMFEPRSIEVVGDCVIAEGWEGAQVYWVHVWTLKDGLITQFREYFNTWLTVRDVKPPRWEIGHDNPTLWQSQPRDLARRSLPGLLLAI
ncbi:wound-induced protein 1 [Gossypium australe]|uniref:Wound-induced protein 1 n=1 Tax=Gossypium australe TaxID=47621 RepID=A0A5B6V6L6_9ROSI|nr:wound-induced protein 1 [Gossypium australe]